MRVHIKKRTAGIIRFLLLLMVGVILLAFIINIASDEAPEGEMITFFSRASIQTAIDEGRLPETIGRQLLEQMPSSQARISLRWQGLQYYQQHPDIYSIMIDSDFNVIAH